MDEVTVRVECEINPTESEEKVKTAVTNVVGNVSAVIQSFDNVILLTGEAVGRDSLVKLRNLFRSDRIRDSARKALYRSIKGKTVSFCLNKQVAFAGHVSFCEEMAESPLGPIRVAIGSDSPRQLVEWLAEKTC